MLAKEKTGADILEREGVINKMKECLRTEKNSEIILAFIRVMGEMCTENPSRVRYNFQLILYIFSVLFMHITNR